MPVGIDRRAGEVAVLVDGDLTCAATLVRLHAVLSSIAFTGDDHVVVDLTATTGASPRVMRLLDRTSRVMRRRGIPFRVVRALVDA